MVLELLIGALSFMKFTESLLLLDKKVENMECLIALDEENHKLMALNEDTTRERGVFKMRV